MALTSLSTKKAPIPVHAVNPSQVSKLGSLVSAKAAALAKTMSFKAASGEMLIVPSDNGKIEAVVFGLGNDPAPFGFGALAKKLPAGAYSLQGDIEDAELASLGWLLGSYKFDRYKKMSKPAAQLVPPKGTDRVAVNRAAEATALVRDLINTPANDMGPDELEKAARKMARSYKARVSVIKGDALLAKNFPMIHAVGRASSRAPRLIDMKWGSNNAPKITLVGKGVVFDTGGLNIKSGNSMTLMKKDMGGAANILGLAQMIMDAKLNVRLRVLIPAVENAISANAFRPGDILPSRKGITVEIGNTDAEGRLILADALALGDEENPDMMIDMATLTGAARVALGPDLPPFYCDDQKLVSEIQKASEEEFDPLWHMPLWKAYNADLGSKVADVNHISTGGFAGSITAALFLQRFVDSKTSWAHFDVYGWAPKQKPWVDVGGEAQGIRALFNVLHGRYGKGKGPK